MIGWPGEVALAPNSPWAARHRVLLVALLFVSWPPRAMVSAILMSKLPVSVMAGVAGVPAKLPCVVIQKQQEDYPILVLWYKDGARLPFYTIDLREPADKEYIDEEVKGRVRAEVSEGGHLTLDPLQGSDAGRYKCRVDFRDGPTLSAFVNLTVYVMPSRLVVLNEESHMVSSGLLGPLTEDSRLTLYCVATGGRPPPEVTWWRGSELLANRSLVLGEDGSLLSARHAGGTGLQVSVGVHHVRTELTIPALTRNHARANLTCRASNNNLTEPLHTTVSLDLYLRPSNVVVRPPQEPLVEGRKTRLECVASGAYPSAVITWQKTRGGKTTTEEGESRMMGNKTVSLLTFIPEAEDNGATLTCRAHNPSIPGQGMHTTTVLQVTFKPRVKLRLGVNLGGRPITEAEDVYFECEIACNPGPREVLWHKDGLPVYQDMKAGIIVSQKNLVLQMVRRTSAGNYTCTASNALGTTTSNVVPLSIRYLPVCRDGPQTVAVAEGEDVRLTCRVDAQPDENLRFTWYFNNTLDTVEVEGHRVEVRKGRSFLDYTPRSARDYGTLSCWAMNIVGTQADPCRFTVVEAGPPERVANCVLVNLTVGTLEVGCTPGNDGGLPQYFVARVYTSPTHILLATLQEQEPRFHVGGLTPGQDYLITITAVNAKGASEPEEIDAIRLKVAEKRMGDVSSPPVSPLVGVFLGLVGGFVLLLLAGILLTRARSSNRCACLRQRDRGAGESGSTSASSKKGVGGRGISSPCDDPDDEDDDEDGPDVVKTANETAQLLEGQKCPEIIPARRPQTYTHTTVLSQASTKEGSQLAPNGTGGRGLFRDAGSPHHLAQDESFV
ncbi:neural cell adhesion molecule 1-like isoform X2 [Portunus trituberculatus]|uniref:neural cell adhesion molecule 1-like isoform X2 n=1 Tax=Portunus trituberculatus TaxID=210409 RepID=UPI001E1CF3ED|nr:neural cell adhesion molecule 1-like isoform X2 [Portunus trituberculatus]